MEEVIAPRATKHVGDLSHTDTSPTTHPRRRRIAVDENYLSYHHIPKLHNCDGLIVTTEQDAREAGAVPCTKCFGGGTQYNFDYTDDGGVLP